MPTWPASKEFKEEVEDVVEVVGSLGRHFRDIVAGALLGGHALPAVALAERVQVVGHLPDVGALGLLLDAPPHSARRRRQCGQCWKEGRRVAQLELKIRKEALHTDENGQERLHAASPRFHLRLLRPPQVTAAACSGRQRRGQVRPGPNSEELLKRQPSVSAFSDTALA